MYNQTNHLYTLYHPREFPFSLAHPEITIFIYAESPNMKYGFEPKWRHILGRKLKNQESLWKNISQFTHT